MEEMNRYGKPDSPSFAGEKEYFLVIARVPMDTLLLHKADEHSPGDFRFSSSPRGICAQMRTCKTAGEIIEIAVA